MTMDTETAFALALEVRPCKTIPYMRTCALTSTVKQINKFIECRDMYGLPWDKAVRMNDRHRERTSTR